jgi:hypothetical protein
MAGKVIDDSATGVLILIIPFALAIVLLFTAWPLILVLVLLGAVWNIWQRYQWLKWSEQINPSFHHLIRINQGCLTAMDLAMKANISGTRAKRYLDIKAKEFGIRAIEYEDKGTVYYFTTGSTLNSLLDGSEIPREIAIAPSTTAAQMLVEPAAETEPSAAESLTTEAETPVPVSVETEPTAPEQLTASAPSLVEPAVETEPSPAAPLTTEAETPVPVSVETEPTAAEPLTTEAETPVPVPVETEPTAAETPVAVPVETEPSPAASLATEAETPVPVSVETEAREPEQLTAEADTPTEEQTAPPPEQQQPTPSDDDEQLEPVAAEKSPKKLMAFGSLIQIELANRLGVHSSTVYKRRYDSDFPQWSKSRDPQGIAWEYSEDTKEFYPVENK